MKIGIYGGTFNPIHSAHVRILEAFCSKLNFDKVLIIPTKQPPHKEAENLITADKRIEMIRLALEDSFVNAEISDIELKRENKSFTIDTLKQLREIYPTDEFYLMMGEDMFLTVDKWYKGDEILKRAVICGIPRTPEGYEKMCEHVSFLKEKFPFAKFELVNIPCMQISSTEVRNSVKNRDEHFRQIVPQKVADYIEKNSLYI